MKYIIQSFSLIMLSLIEVNAQETKLVVKNSGNLNEEYYVLKANRRIKHGNYICYYLKSDVNIVKEEGKYFDSYFLNDDSNIFLIAEGAYSMGKKDGLWKRYYNNKVIELVSFKSDSLDGVYFALWNDTIPIKASEKIRQKGSDSLIIVVKQDSIRPAIYGFHKNGAKDSVWSFFSRNNKLYFQYDYNNKILIKDDYYNLRGIEVDKTSEIKQPVYLRGGTIGLKYDILSFISEYSYLLKDTICLQFFINKEGYINSVKMNNSTLNKKIAKIIEKELKEECDNWIPKRVDNQNVESVFDFKFALSKKESWPPKVYN